MKTKASVALCGSLFATLAVTAGHPAPAHATPYEAFIDVETEDDLYDLLAASQISSETFEILRTLLARGVDLDSADRDAIYSLPNLTYDDVDAILAYRATEGFVGDPAALVGAGALTEQKLLAIAPFLVVRSRDRGANRPRGWIKLSTRAANGDDRVPAMGVRARVMVGRRLTAGLAGSLTRLRIGAPVWDPNRDGLIADAAALRPNLPKLYVRYHGDELEMIAGSYRIGFGQRLTFDNSSDYTPNGIYFDDQLSRDDTLARRCRTSTGELAGSPCTTDLHYITPDFRWSEGLRGVAAGVDHLAAGTGYVQAYVWGSYAARSLYQYELVNRAICADPRNDGDPNCAAPPVFVRPAGDPLTATAEHTYQTLPDVYAEALVGGNLTFHARRRDYVGVTAYGATKQWLIDTPDGVQLDTQEWSKVPTGNRFGAIGVNVGAGRGVWDYFGEATYSFDEIPKDSKPGSPITGGGGPAVILRTTRTVRHREFELSARYYDPNFVNPYAGPIAAADELEGQRARGEHGVRARYTGTHGGLTIHTVVDLWRALANTEASSVYEYVPRLDLDVRGDLAGTERLRYGLGVHYQNKDLGRSSSNQCYEIVFQDDQNGEPVACTGSKLSTIGHVRWTPDRKTTLIAQLQHAVLDDTHTPTSARQDVVAVATASYRARPGVRLRARVRYRNEDVTDNMYLEESLATFVDAAIKLRKKDQLQVRADLVLWLDDRANTKLRQPSPEVWLGASYQAAF